MNEVVVTVVRGLIAFVSLVIMARLLGKQQIAQLTFFEYVLGITIGSIASSMTVDLSIKALPQWVGLLTWTGAVLVTQWITIRWRSASKYIDGEPTIVVMEGKIMEKAMEKLRYRASDLLEQLRIHGVFNVDEVAYAILEPSGQLSVLRKPEYEGPIRKDFDMKPKMRGVEVELIYGGVVIEQNLLQIGADRRWLDEELRKHCVHSPTQVFLATVDANRKLFIDSYRDHVQHAIDIDDELPNEGNL